MRRRGSADLLAAAALIFAAACSGNGADPSACAPSQDPRFVLTSQEGVSELSLDASRRRIIGWPDETYPLDPAVSPDCRRIAFALQRPAKPLPGGGLDFGSDIVVTSIDGKGLRQLAEHQRVAEFLRTPAWLSDGELLYTYRGRGAGGEADLRIERIEVSTGNSRRYIESAIDPAVSGDGRHLAFIAIDPVTQGETLTIARTDLAGLRGLVGPDQSLALFSAHVFSPDGGRIAFAAVDTSQPLTGGSLPVRAQGVYGAHPFAQDVWLVNADGTGLRRLAEVAENMPSIAWSVDGATVYVLGPGAFWRIDAATGEATKIGPGIPQGQIARLSRP